MILAEALHVVPVPTAWETFLANLPAIAAAIAAAWGAYQATKAKSLGQVNQGGIGAVHQLVNSQRTALEDRLAAAEHRLGEAIETIKTLTADVAYRKGQAQAAITVAKAATVPAPPADTPPAATGGGA